MALYLYQEAVTGAKEQALEELNAPNVKEGRKSDHRVQTVKGTK